jgi:hypothetical protein
MVMVTLATFDGDAVREADGWLPPFDRAVTHRPPTAVS